MDSNFDSSNIIGDTTINDSISSRDSSAHDSGNEAQIDSQREDSETNEDVTEEKQCVWQAQCRRFECCSEICGTRLDGSVVLANTFIWGCCEPANPTCVDMGDGRWCCQE